MASPDDKGVAALRLLQKTDRSRSYRCREIFSCLLVVVTMVVCSIVEAYPLRAPADPILNSADRDLKSIRSWHYVMGAGDLDVFARRDWPIQAVDASQYPYEMMVTELRSGQLATANVGPTRF